MKILFLSFMIMMISCASNWAIDEEKILFPEQSKSKLWMINVISTDSVLDDRHVNILISYTPVSGKNYVSFYTSFWSENDQNYSSGFHSEEIPIQKNKLSFPIKIETVVNDSIHEKSRWEFGRNKMHYQTGLYNEAFHEYLNFKMKAVFEKKMLFSISDGPRMAGILPVNAEIKLSGDYKDQFPASISQHVIHDPKEIIDKSKNNFIGFLDLRFRNEKYCSILFETDGADYTTILDQSFWENGQHIYQNYPSKMVSDQDGKWQSSHSGKSYPLGYFITLPYFDKQIYLKPILNEQELMASKNSFWMGAVKLYDKKDGSSIGEGNLYILKQ